MTPLDWFLLMCGGALSTVALNYTAPSADLTPRDVACGVALVVTVGLGGAWLWSLL